MAQHEIAHDNHPGPKKYVVIGLTLAIITFAEVGAFYIEATSALVVSILLMLSFLKFAIVVGYFMHLKFDDKRFLGLFVVPFIIMISIIVALLAVFDNLTR
jgi:cytochrome c oxidase subunit 4